MIYNYQPSGHSVITPYIKEFVSMKRSVGYKYDDETAFLNRFDKYWEENGDGTIELTYEKLAPYLKKKPTETARSHSHRIGVYQVFAKYMNEHGMDWYIPAEPVRYPRPLVHVLTDEEVKAFFHEIDSYIPLSRTGKPVKRGFTLRLAFEYRVLFRLILCLGLRLSEACHIRLSDVDLRNHRIKMCYGTKKENERYVYLGDDLIALLQRNIDYCAKTIGHAPYWLFPGAFPEKPINIHTVDRFFNSCWERTPYAKSCSIKPTVHSLRHTYVVKRLNLWMEEGVDIEVMKPYMSAFLGHKNFDDATFYYYHEVLDAFRIVKKKDTHAKNVIKGVMVR